MELFVILWAVSMGQGATLSVLADQFFQVSRTILYADFIFLVF
jgi:hypothetical protein